MKVLFIGGTGTISMAITRLLAERGDELYLLNRGNRNACLPAGVKTITADINDEQDVLQKLGDMTFDCVGEFIGFVPAQLERDYRLFAGRTKQFIYISSASAYQKPLQNYLITEQTPLENPYWEYYRNKKACEEYLFERYRQDGFPVTVVRPSHTYDERNVPLGVHGNKGPWQVIRRMLDGKPVIIQGDGSSLWTMTFNTDFATGFIGLMANPHAIGEAFQITGDETLTWNQIYQAIADGLGVELKAYHVATDFLVEAGRPFGYDFEGSLLGDKSVSVVFDNRKLKRAVPDMVTKVPFARGVRITLDYVLSHPECQTADPEFDAWCDRVIEAQEKAKQLVTEAAGK